MTTDYSLHPDELELWANFYKQSLTVDGKETIVLSDGSKQLVLLPMMAYTLISTILQKLKYLSNDCFNILAIREISICGLRPLTRTSSTLMHRITEILRIIVDGVRKQHILRVTMILHNKNDINITHNSCSLVFDYTIKSLAHESNTPIHTIAHILHQIQFVFNSSDALPSDVELTFVLSVLDQFENKENQLPKPFYYFKEGRKNSYQENETKNLLGRLLTPDGKIVLTCLSNNQQLSENRVNSDEQLMETSLSKEKVKKIDIEVSQILQPIIEKSLVTSPRLKKKFKKTAAAIESHKIESNSPPIISPKVKKKTGLLSTVKSLITLSRKPALVKSSTPNATDLVLIRHTSTPKPGETASRITIDRREESTILSTIPSSGETCSPAPSTLTATDISTAATPMFAVERRSTVRGQAAAARKKIAAMRIHDDEDNEDHDDDEEFNDLFIRSRKTKTKTKSKSTVSTNKVDNIPEVSSISPTVTNPEVIFTPPTARKRMTTDRAGDDDLITEHGTPPKTPRTSRRNRIDDQSSTQTMASDTSEVSINVDSPRLLRSVTKKLQQQAFTKTISMNENKTVTSNQSIIQEITTDSSDIHHAFVQLERSSIALHYSMDESEE